MHAATKSNTPPSSISCFAEDGGDYLGFPEPGEKGKETPTKAVLHLSTTRLLVGADYLVGANVSVGVRLGYAFNVAPRAGAGAIHAEGRVAYWFGSSPFAKTGIRPYAAVMGGMAEMDTKFTVPIIETAPARIPTQRDHHARADPHGVAQRGARLCGSRGGSDDTRWVRRGASWPS